MSLKHNVMANYLGRAYTASIGLIMVPVYLRYLGKEAYGLVGFYAVLSGCLVLLDLGLTQAFGREAARYLGGRANAGRFRSLLRILLLLFSIGGLVVVIVVAALSGFITDHWLNIETIARDEVKISIALMGLVFALRFPAELFRSVLTGFEHQVSLNTINVLMATLRFIGIVPVFIWVGASPEIFFIFQGAMAVVELIVLAAVCHPRLPPWPKNYKKSLSLKPIYEIWGFALSATLLSLIWMIMTQTDKLILTRLLPLSTYAYYSIAASAAMGILALLGPITQAVLPRLTRLAAKKDDSAFESLYGKTTRMICILAGSTAVILAAYPKEILWAWTGDTALAVSAFPVLAFYGLGYAFLTLSDMQYFLQVAHGNLRLHIKGHFLFLLLLVPSLIWAVLHYGMIGAAVTWMMINLLFLLVWVPVVHHRFLPGFHKTWLFHDVFPVSVVLGIMLFLMGQFPIKEDSRTGVILSVAVWSVITLTAAGLTTPEGRSMTVEIIKRSSSFFRRKL